VLTETIISYNVKYALIYNNNRSKKKMVIRKLIFITLTQAIFVINTVEGGKYTKLVHNVNTKTNI